MRAHVLVVGSLWLLGCASNRAVEVSLPGDWSVPAVDRSILPDEFARSLGFDALVPMEDAEAIQAGDSVLYRVWFHHGDQDVEWYIRIELDQPDPRNVVFTFTTRADGGESEVTRHVSKTWNADVQVFEVGQEELVEAELWLARTGMKHSLFDSASYFGADSLQGPEERLDFALGMASMMNAFEGWQGNRHLRPMLKRVIGVPVRAMVGALFSGSLSYSVQFDTPAEGGPREVELPEPVGVLPALRVPARIELGSSDLMALEIVTVPAAAPLSVGLNIVQMRGVHPRDDGRWIQIDLVGARRAR